MKKIFTLLFLTTGLVANAQIENAVHVIGAGGSTFGGDPIISFGVAGNLSHAYFELNGSIGTNPDLSPVKEARVGVIIGKGLAAVPYVGLGLVGRPMAMKGKPFQAKNGLAAGFILVAPTGWERVSFAMEFNFLKVINTRELYRGQIMAGFKMRLTDNPCL